MQLWNLKKLQIYEPIIVPMLAHEAVPVAGFVQEVAAIQAERARGPGEPVTTNPKLGAPTEGAGDPASPASQHSEGYEEMLDRHHESLIENTRISTARETIDSLFASSVENLYDANGKHCRLQKNLN